MRRPAFFVRIDPMRIHTERHLWIALFALWALHAIFILIQFFPDELRPRVIVLVFPLAWLAFSAWMLYRIFHKEIQTHFPPHLRDRTLLLSISLFLIRILLWSAAVLFAGDSLGRIRGYLEILAPALNLIGYLSFELALLLGYLNLRDTAGGPFFNNIHRKLTIVFAALAFLFVLVARTDLGIAVTHQGDWGRGQPAVPLLEWQILLACLFGLFIAWREIRMRKIGAGYDEILICVFIYAGAVAIWLSQPVIPSASALEPRAPNYEIYPFIDAQTYDEFAQSALVGEGFGRGIIPQRPLYIVFLTFAHVLAGQSYNHVIVFQTLLWAFFPVLLYLFGRDFMGRPLGVSIALLAILRDHLMNLVAPITGNASYSKLYLSEIPTAMGLALFLWLAMRWMRFGFPARYAFLIGGVLGASLLIRTQAVVALPVLILFAMLHSSGSWRRILKQSLLIAAVCAAMAFPWLLRNRMVAGQFAFDSPESQTANLALRYGYLMQMDNDIRRLTGESNAEYSARLKQMARASILKDPGLAVWGVANSFFNHGVNNILVFPLRLKIESPREIFIPADAFWQQWEGRPARAQLITILFYIFLFGLGLVFAWQRNGWLGLMPLALNLVYNLWTSLALLSGQRFMLAMDWSVYAYMMTGLFACIGFVLYLFLKTRPMVLQWLDNFTPKESPDLARRPFGYVYWGLLFFVIGCSLYATEKIFPQRYPPLPQGSLPASLEQFLASSADSATTACIKKNRFEFVRGRALYPRYYAAGDGETFTDSFGYKRTNESRIVFSLTGQRSSRIVFPLDEEPPFFPHAADVTLLYIEGKTPVFIFLQMDQTEYLYASATFDPLHCQIK